MTESNFLATLFISAIIGGCVLFLTLFIIRVLKNNQVANVTNKRNVNRGTTAQQPQDKEQQHRDATSTGKAATGKRGKGTEQQKWGGGSRATDYTHPWLLTSLKGHTGQVYDMDFSSNGKYLASCADEPDPGGPVAGPHHHPTPNNIDCNKENSRPAETTTSSANNKGLSRRQRKNRRREDSSPPLVESKKKTRSKRGGNSNNTAATPNGVGHSTMDQHGRRPMPLLKQFAKLGLTELQVGSLLRTSYTLGAEQMLSLGYPVESELHPGRAIIFKSPMTAPNHHYNPYKAPVVDSRFDVNAREFVPQQYYVDYSQIKQAWGSGSSGSSDSSSEPASLEDQSDDSSAGQDPTVSCSGAAVRTSDTDALAAASEERQCVRCGHGFFVASDGEYLTQEHCVYHWGKVRRNFTGPGLYSCCGAEIGSPGCSTGKLHVWNGVGVGFNGPFDSYARTRPRRTPPPDGNLGVYALDCEMCYTVGGLELAKVTVVGADGRLVYDCLVRPERDVVDYNTRFSGITARDLSRKSLTKTLREVQNDLMGFINADTVLVGHGLENDLRALRIMHATVVDTAVTFPHYNGLPYRRSLKSLTQCYLKRDIQSGVSGHNSCEDARACMELMLWRIRKDFRPFLEQMEQQHHHHHHHHHHQ